MKLGILQPGMAIAFIFCCSEMLAQPSAETGQPVTEKQEKQRKNIVRYNLSGPLLFGIDKYIVLGYERVISPRNSISVNFGKASLPKFVSFSTDSFQIQKDLKNTGYNISIDYRFYLSKENKFEAPHGVYLGLYYSFNRFDRENNWSYQKGSAQETVGTTTTFKINTMGAEMGYQFIIWKRLAIDLVLVGPGFSNYDLTTTTENNLSDEAKARLQEAIKQLLTQRFPGMNYVFSNEEFNANGNIRTWNFGYRYLVHIGFAF
jgi:Protein of unknown function (DUF3575)